MFGCEEDQETDGSEQTDDDQVDDDTDQPDDDAVIDDDQADDDVVDDDIVDDDQVDDDVVDDDTALVFPYDDVIQINHIQGKGTHNSYHVRRDGICHPEHRYTHEPLDVQLDLGVRQFELDAHWLPGFGFRIFHILVIDTVSTCYTMGGCLGLLKAWSDEHPYHHPILVLLEAKDDFGVSLIAEHTLDMEAEILDVWPRERIITPDDVRGDYETLREAIVNEGWPVLGDARGKAIFHAHNSGNFRAAYLDIYPDLEGALMFTDSRPEDPYGAICIMNDPISGGGAIMDAVMAGFLVRTRADSCCDNAIQNDHTQHYAALDSGANFISTDFPVPVDGFDYWVEIPDGTPSRCNPLTAPDFCTSFDIEHGYW